MSATTELLLEDKLATAIDVARSYAEDFEIIVVANGSSDDTVELLRSFCNDRGVPNLQVFVLTRTERIEVAAWAGVENALGDYVAVLNPTYDEIGVLPRLLEAAMVGADAVFAENTRPRPGSVAYRMASQVFSGAARQFLKIDARQDLPSYRLLSRRLVNYMLRYDASGASYRWLPAASGFRKSAIRYESIAPGPRRRLLGDLDRGLQLLVSSTSGPMRLMTLLSLFGAGANLLYSVYVIAVGLLMEDVEPGWVTLSLQQSGMFFLLSLVLLILGEYVLHVLHTAQNAPSYHVAEEFASAVITRRERLNVEIGDGAEATRLDAAMLKPRSRAAQRARGR